jgi:hypothetical protein
MVSTVLKNTYNLQIIGYGRDFIASINGPDVDNNGKVEIKDLSCVAKYYERVLGLSIPLDLASASVAIVFPVGVFFWRKKRKQQLKALEN